MAIVAALFVLYLLTLHQYATAQSLPAAARPSSSPHHDGGGRAARSCPVQGEVAFADTWGAARSGGRRHKGVDMFAAAGTPVVAPVRATVARAGWNRLGGNGVTLRTPQGTELYFAHLRDPAAVRPGQHLAARQVLGRVGNTGNAARTPAHLHLEVRPGGVAVDPTPYARGWCRR